MLLTTWAMPEAALHVGFLRSTLEWIGGAEEGVPILVGLYYHLAVLIIYHCWLILKSYSFAYEPAVIPYHC
jgi:hypothetical protein